MLTVILFFFLGIQIRLVEDNLLIVSQGLYDVVSQATENQDQTQSTLEDITAVYRDISRNCTSNNPQVILL